MFRFLVVPLMIVSLTGAQFSKEDQLKSARIDTNGQIETIDVGVKTNTANSLRAGPRGYVLLEDTATRKKLLHFDRERQPERVVHALGHGAYGTFESYGDWSNLTSACWLGKDSKSEVFTRFSVVVASTGGSEVGRDTHGFATKIYSACGNHDLVGNHVPSFFINDGADFPDLVHAVKYEPDKGFPTGGSAHTTAYDFFTKHPEGTFQLMTVLSDLGIPRDVRHISGNGVHTFRFLNAAGESTLFKWYWKPVLGHRALVYDEATKIAGKNGNFQRIDMFSNIEAGIFPEWEFQVQLFPDDGTYMWNGIDLIDPTMIIPFEMNPPITLGKLTLNKNPTNFFAEPESISFAPSNVVKGVTFVPDPLLQWRLMSYDDTATHRHNSPNGYLLPINRAISPINNNYRDGYMQPLLFEGASTSAPNGIGGVVAASAADTYAYTGSKAEVAEGPIGRYANLKDSFDQARVFWNTLDRYAQQHTVDAYRFELGHVSDAKVQQTYINEILNKVDNCLARRVAFGIGAPLPALGSGPYEKLSNNTKPKFPSLYPLASSVERKKSNEGLIIGILGEDNYLSAADLAILKPILAAEKVSLEIIASHIGLLTTGISATQSYITTSSIFYDAIIIGSPVTASIPPTNPKPDSSSSSSLFTPDAAEFIREAYSHGKAIAAIDGDTGAPFKLLDIDIAVDPALGVFRGDAASVARSILTALSGPVRFPQRFETDDLRGVCEG